LHIWHPSHSTLFPYTTLFRSDTTFELRDNKLRVNLAQPAKAGEKFDVNLQYEGKPTSGLYFILPDKDDPGRPKEIWTQGEAEDRSEEHTSELQSRGHLVCRLQ